MIKKRLLKIIICVISFITVFLIIFLNKDYNFNKVIKDYKSYNLYKIHRYVSIDLSNNDIYRLNETEIKSKDYDCYIVNFDKVDVLVLLKKNSDISDKTNLKKVKDNELVKNIKKNYKDMKFTGYYYTNENFNINKDLIKIKLYTLYAIMGLLLFLIIKEIILIILRK